MTGELSRKEFLKSVALLGGAAGLGACGDSAVGAQSKGGERIVRAGTLYEVVDARGVRAGRHGPQTERLSTSRTAFENEDAYRQLGHWYFFHDAGGALHAVRDLFTAAAGSRVTITLPGFETELGPCFASSVGTLVFKAGGADGSLTCHLFANNFHARNWPPETGTSPYFVAQQTLVEREATALAADARDRINATIADAAARLRLAAADLHYLPG